MRLPKRLLISILFLTLASCDGAEHQPNAPASNDPTTLAIVSLGMDSLYWGEESWLVLNEPRNSTKGLKLFVKSHKMIIDRCEDGKLYFHSQANAEGGPFRLYDNDALASGEQQVTFLPHDVHFSSGVYYTNAPSGYVNATLYLGAYDIPLRDRDWDVHLGDMRVDAEFSSLGYIFMRIPSNAKSGKLDVRVFDQHSDLGHFEVLKHTSPFLQERTLRAIDLVISNVTGLVRSSSDPLQPVMSDAHSASMTITFDETQAVTQDGDTLRLHYHSSQNGERTVELAVVEDQFGSISGRISMLSLDGAYEFDQRLEVKFKDLPWQDDGFQYATNVFGPLIRKQLLNATDRTLFNGELQQELVTYLGVTANSGIAINFRR
jgi:hypothetical protein